MDEEKKVARALALDLALVYPMLVEKAVKKGRSPGEVEALVCWQTGYTKEELEAALAAGMPYGEFFARAPKPHPDRMRVRGRICGYMVEEIGHPLMREIRILDKMVDDLAKGKDWEKILPRPLEEGE